MTRRIIFCSFLFLVSLTGCAPPAANFPGKAGTFASETIEIGNVWRAYRLEVPASVDLTKPVPLVFAFHGMGEDNKDNMPKATGLTDLAAKNKFIIVYPAANELRIPQGIVTGWALTPEQAQQDLAFFDALLAKLKTEYNIDPNRIYTTGMSNGGYFAHLVTRERADTIAAVAAHSGELGQLDLEKIATGRKFPVMIIHGDVDMIFPVAVARAMRDAYTTHGHPVKLVIIPGLGHAWATKAGVNDQIWEFFATNPLNAAKK